MLFRAIITNPDAGGHKQTAIKLDPWEENLGQRRELLADALNWKGPIPIEEWIVSAWPRFVYDSDLQEVGNDRDYTLFRREIDLENEKRWHQGERFQVDSFR